MTLFLSINMILQQSVQNNILPFNNGLYISKTKKRTSCKVTNPSGSKLTNFSIRGLSMVCIYNVTFLVKNV